MFRIGESSDIHKLVKGRKLILGGIVIPSEVGESAHSDGDVLLHAITEAIIGALGLNDLGYHFPNTKEYQDISSLKLLGKAKDLLREYQYQIVNIDSSIYLESPKLRDYIDKMKINVSEVLKIEKNQINIKAGTMEGMDAIGRKEAISASAIVLIKKINN